MKQTIVLTVLLCLAAVTLAIGAAPALAADGCTCHTAVPPTATAAHAPLVVGVADCATCHVDWTVPHPDSRTPTLWVRLLPWGEPTGNARRVLAARQFDGFVGWMLPAGPGVATKGHPNVVVYLEQRVWGETDFTDVGQTTSDTFGGFGFTVASPPPFAAYRAVAQGHVGTPLLVGPVLCAPALTKLTLMMPRPALKLDGVKDGIVRLGRSVTALGTVRPSDIGVKVTIRVQKRVAGKWVTRITVKRGLSATGACNYRFTPRHLGLLRVQIRTPKTDVWMNTNTTWRKFRVE